MTTSAKLGAPKVYAVPSVAAPSLAGIRMDVAAFVGVALRGPCREPIMPETWDGTGIPDDWSDAERRRSVAVAVESLEEFRRRYGGFEGPGRLPHAAAAFFEQGGRRAYVVRIVPDYGNDDVRNLQGTARGVIELEARDPLSLLDVLGDTEVVITAAGISGGDVLVLELPDGTRMTRLASVVMDGQPAAGQSTVTVDRSLHSIPIGVELAHGLLLEARDEGSWGNLLTTVIGFTATPLDATLETSTRLIADEDTAPAIGSLVRHTAGDGAITLAFVVGVAQRESEDGVLELTLDTSLSVAATVATLEVIEAEVLIDDGVDDAAIGVVEHHTALGLSPDHRRWIADVLFTESTLVRPHLSWTDTTVIPDAVRAPLDDIPLETRLSTARHTEFAVHPQFDGGEDRFADIVHADFHDPTWVLGNPDPGDGLAALAHIPDLASVVVPDLYVPEALPELGDADTTTSLAGATFADCVEAEITTTTQSLPELEQLLLDPTNDADLDLIIELQRLLVNRAEQLQVVALLDVPPGLTRSQMRRWRNAIVSSYAACYHPWVRWSHPDDERDEPLMLNPAAIGAGVIAARELAFGVPHGPANAVARGVVGVEETVSSTRHDELHPLGINVLIQERQGVRLTGARTLSRDRAYRQLSVRRLMLMLLRVLEQQTQWIVFEPNTRALWRDVRNMIRSYLRRLYRQGAFAGATEEESFFVRCDETTTTTRDIDAGRLIVLVGVAPAEPIEFIELRITRTPDDVTVEEL